MIFLGNNWCFGALAVVIFSVLNFLAYNVIARNSRVGNIVVAIISIYLFVYKVYEYIPGGRYEVACDYPIDFSAVSYFLFAFAVWMPRLKNLKGYVAFIAIISGIIYDITAIVFPNMYAISAGKFSYITILALINHNLLYLGGLTFLTQIKLEKPDLLLFPFGASYNVAYAYLMEYCTTAVLSNKTIFHIVDGTIVTYVNLPKSPTVLSAYYFGIVLVGTIYALTILQINKLLYKKPIFLTLNGR